MNYLNYFNCFNCFNCFTTETQRHGELLLVGVRCG